MAEALSIASIDEIKAELRKILSKHRYVHSLGVAGEAEKLARRYGADTAKAYLAGWVSRCSAVRVGFMLSQHVFAVAREWLPSPTAKRNLSSAPLTRE